jgi:tetratricopeptide (TPR) repeat protein
LPCGIHPQGDTAKVNPLTPPDSHHLSAAQGWIELGNHLEAGAELDKITPELRPHPDVLEIRWQLHAKENRWQDCEAIGHAIIGADPNRPSGWLNQATALRRQGKFKEAYANLYVVFDDFPDNWHVPYDLARYSALLGELDEAREWFKKAIAMEKSTVQKKGVSDPNLKPMWDSFQTPI